MYNYRMKGVLGLSNLTTISEKTPFEKIIALADEETLEHVLNQSQKFVKLMSYYRCAMMEIETKLKVLDMEYSLEHDRNPISNIKTRLKDPKSMKLKLEKRGLPVTFQSMEQHLNDIAGVRVICAFPEDVYAIAESFLKQDDITLIEKKDYIKNPKPNGYRSLHLIVAIPIFLAHEKKMMKVEIQLRTIAMDFWASLEHQLRYKKDAVFTEKMAQELLECAEISSKLDIRMETLRKQVQGNSAK